MQGRRLRGDSSWRDGGAFIPHNIWKMSLQTATKMKKRERKDETPMTVTNVQATWACYLEAAATAYSCQTFQQLAAC